MTNKTFTLLSLGILALLVLTSFASALAFTSSNTITFTNPDISKEITITTDEESNFTILSSTFEINNVNFKVENTTTLNNTDQITLKISNSSNLDYSKFKLAKSYTGTFNVNANNGTSDVNQIITVKIENSYCKYGDVGDVEITSIKDERLGNSKSWEWKPLDEISLKIGAENNVGSKESITVAIKLYSEDGTLIELDGDDELEETIKLKDGDSEYFYFNFRLPVEDIEEGNYVLYVKAFVDGEEDNYCYSKMEQDIEVEFEDEAMIDKPDFTTLSCGDSQDLTFEIYNLDAGDDETFRLRVYNKELGINWHSSEFDLDEGDSKKVIFPLQLPDDVTEKTYLLSVFLEYDYKSSTDSFRESIDSTISIKVEGSCSTTPTATISAKLDSEAEAGKDLVVKATIINTGSETKTFTLSADSYEDWASSATFDKSSVTLSAGQSTDVLITLAVSKDAEGENGFDIEILEGTKYMFQPVSVTIEKASLFPSLTGFVSGFGDNAYLYGIGALNIILVAAIIFVAVKVARRKQE